MFDSKTGGKIKEKAYEVNIDYGLEILKIYNNDSKILSYEGHHLLHYLDKNNFEILSFDGFGYISDFSNQHNIVWYDEKNMRLRTMSLIPEDIIHKIRVEKEFGEIPNLSKEDKLKYGLN